MPQLPINWLYSFVTFAESRSMAEAAHKLGLTQPALSKQLKALDESLKSKALTQSGKRKVLTPFGKILHQELRERLLPIHQVIQQAEAQFLNPAKAQVRIAARREILDRLSEHLDFEGQVTFLEQSHDQILQSLRDRQIDFGITHATPNTSEWIARPLYKETFQIAVPHKLASRLQSKDLASLLPTLPCLAYKAQDEVLAAACRAWGIDEQSLILKRITSNYASLAKMVDAGLGWTVLPVYFSLKKSWLFPLNPRVFSPREFKVLFRRELTKTEWFKPLLQEMNDCWSPVD